MDYKYDVFISYKSYSKEWVRDVFFPPFEFYLREIYDDNVKIFVDWEGIEGGNAWSNRLKNALAHSKCLLPILLPTYFESEWCKKEFAVMEHRSKQYKLCTLDTPEGLIVPISIFDGDCFPASVRDLQIVDYENFFQPNVSGYTGLEKYSDFQNEVKKLAYTVAKAIRIATVWESDWLNDEWLELPTDHLNKDKTKILKPRI
jgi:TIR domain